MLPGFETALGEITLVLFTTLAPSGAVSLCLLGALLFRQDVTDEHRGALNKIFALPLLLTLVGLVASTTHLGNPGNALYVLCGVGRSPLSNEVFCAALFIGCAALYWLYSFAEKPRFALQRALLVALWILGVAFLFALALAYHAETIISWYTLYVPLSLILNALVGGSILTILCLQFARCATIWPRLPLILALVSLAALLCALIVYVLQIVNLATLRNALAQGADFIPAYLALIGAFAACSLAGILLDGRALFKESLTSKCAALSCALVFLGIFAARFAFYTIHLTV